MLKITNWKDLSTLTVKPPLLDQIKATLTAPFHDEAETQDTWGELRCELWLLNSLSDIPADGVDRDMLAYALEYTEFVDDLYYGMTISLSIVEDTGKGLYLVLSKQLRADTMKVLGVNND